MPLISWGFTSSKHNCFIGLCFMCIEPLSIMLALVGYIFCFLPIIIYIQYVSIILVTIHLCTFVFIVLCDIYFGSDTLIITSQFEQDYDTLEPFEIYSLTAEENKHCFQKNPWHMYRKHYIITTIKIVFVILDIAVLIIFKDAWKCIKQC